MPENNFFKTNAELFVFVGLTLACLAVYAQTVNFQFINFDDNLYVYDNIKVLSGLNRDSIYWAFTAFHSANWHPLTWLSHMADVSLFGSNAGAHHATNIVFHIINTLLAFAVFRKMTGDFWKSAVVAALFAVHPAHVESVAWVSERKDVLSTMFWLLTMFAYFKYAETELRLFKPRSSGETESSDGEITGERRPNNKERTFFYVLTILLFALGLMAKPMLVTLPFVLLLCDYWSLERLKTARDLPRLVVEKIPLFVLSAVSSWVTVLAQKSFGAVQSIEMLPVETRFLNAVVAYAKYFVMFFYPANLAVSYPYKTDFETWRVVASFLLLGGVTAVCLWQWRRRKYLLMGWLWFLGTLVPVIGIVQVGAQAMADRYTYVPYFGLFVMIVWSAEETFARLNLRKILLPVSVAVILIFGFLAFKQTSRWRNNETLYRHTLAVTENNFLIAQNLCNTLMVQDRLDEAAEKCRDAIAWNKNYANAYNTLGVVSVKQNNAEEAVRNFNQALVLQPNDPLTYTNLAIPLSMLGRTDEAEASLNKAAQMFRAGGINMAVVANAYSNLAAAQLNKGEPEKAVRAFARVLEISPERAEIRANYALALFSNNQLEEARRQIEQVIRQAPNQAEPYNTYGLILAAQNQREESIKQFEKALEINPNLSSAQENLKKARGEK